MLMELDTEIRPYLAALMTAAMYRAGQALVIPNDMHLQRGARE